MAAERKPLHSLFHSITVKDVMPEQKEIFTLKTKDSLEAAVKILGEKKILSCPVLDDNNELVGFVDTLDVMKYIASAVPDKHQLERDEVQNLKIAGRAISLVPLTQVVNFSARDAVQTCQVTDPASRLTEMFAKGAHRAAVYDHNRLVGICSQSDVSRYLGEKIHMGECKNVGSKKLADLGYGECKVEKISRKSLVINAVKQLADKGVSALAVIDPDSGRLVGNFSASNLRGLYQSRLPALLDTVDAFLAEHSPASLQPVVGQPTSSLIDIVKTINDDRLHHLWVVQDFKPVGVISLTDIMIIINNATF